jgi:hypothetical protein
LTQQKSKPRTLARDRPIQVELTWEMIQEGAKAFERLVPEDGTSRDPADIVQIIFREMMALCPGVLVVEQDLDKPSAET